MAHEATSRSPSRSGRQEVDHRRRGRVQGADGDGGHDGRMAQHAARGLEDPDLGGDRQARRREERRHRRGGPGRGRQAERELRRGGVAQRADRRPGQRAEREHAHHLADGRARATPCGAFAVSHAMPHVHAMPDAAPWMRPRAAQHLGARREREGQRRGREQGAGDDHHAPPAVAPDEGARGHAGDQHEGRIAGDDDARLDAREVELVGVVRQQRDDGEVERRVHRHGEADGDLDPAHPPEDMLGRPIAGEGGAPCSP